MQSALTDAMGWCVAAIADERADRTGEDAEPVDGRGGEPGDGHDDRDEHGGGQGLPSRDVAREVVTPEERILGFVTENGGSVRQGDVVSAVEWSESTVSRKLSKLESAGSVTRYRIGREKLVFLPGREPESLGSPWREATDASGLVR